MSPIEKINPHMVTIASESRGLVHLDLAEKLNVSKSTAWRLEHEMLATNQDLLRQLSKTLNYPESFFFQKGEVLPLSLSYRKRNSVEGISVN